MLGMKQNFGATYPDMAGYVIVGATAGTVLLGGADTGLTYHSAIGCLAGSLVGPLAVMVPWIRLLRRMSTKRSEALPG